LITFVQSLPPDNKGLLIVLAATQLLVAIQPPSSRNTTVAGQFVNGNRDFTEMVWFPNTNIFIRSWFVKTIPIFISLEAKIERHFLMFIRDYFVIHLLLQPCDD
jgi:hypothetical protein